MLHKSKSAELTLRFVPYKQAPATKTSFAKPTLYTDLRKLNRQRCYVQQLCGKTADLQLWARHKSWQISKSHHCYVRKYWHINVYVSAFSVLTLLVGWQEGHPACKKTEWLGAGMVIWLERGADLHTAQLMPLPLTVSCFSKIQIGFTFTGSPG